MLQTYKTTLTEKIQLTADVYHLKFDLNEPKELTDFIPGQYMIMMVPSDSGSEPIRRLYSIVSPVSQKDSLELIIKIEPNGKASTYVLNMKVGDSVTFQGPAGVFRLKETSKDKIFLATGCGLAPIRSMMLSVIASPDQIGTKQSDPNKISRNDINYHLLWGVPTYKDVYMLDELKQLTNETTEQFKFTICLSREQNFDMIPEADRKYFALGHINDCLGELQPTTYNLQASEFYLCGSRYVTDSLKEYLLQEKKISPEQVIFEKF